MSFLPLRLLSFRIAKTKMEKRFISLICLQKLGIWNIVKIHRLRLCIFYPLAMTMPIISLAPDSRKILAHSAMVAPVV